MDDVVWTALAEPHRRELLAAMAGGERTVGELSTSAGLSQPATSKHLKVLRDAGLVTVRRDRQTRWHAIDAATFDDLAGWIEPYRRRWNDALDRLDAHLATPTSADPEPRDRNHERNLER